MGRDDKMKKQIKSAKRNTFDDVTLFREIRNLIISARKAVVRNVDTIQVITNFEIGRRIVEYEQKGENRAEYGKALLKDLSSRLAKEFGKGFSRANLQNMRNFYIVYRDRLQQKCQMPSGKLIEGQKDQTVSDKSNSVDISENSQMSSRKLQQQGILRRVGPDKGGHWKVG